MKFDDASWHSEGQFPGDLPTEHAAIPGGMFLAWCVFNDLADGEWTEDFEEEVEATRERSIAPAELYRIALDGRLTEEDLSNEGAAFAAFAFDKDGGNYLTVYALQIASGLPSAHHADDSWETYDGVAAMLDEMWATWKNLAK